MIEKGVLLEPFPLAFLVIVFASVTVQDWSSWVFFCVSGLVASVTLYVRRMLRMMEVGKVVDKIVEQSRRVNDHMSVRMASPEVDDECDSARDGEEEVTGGCGEAVTMPFENGQKLRILTYNLYLRPPLINSNGNDWKDERLELFIKHVMPKYDVMALQEVFELGSSRQARLILAAKKLGFKWSVKSVAPPLLTSLKFIDAGLLILSKFPIVEASGHIYSTGHQIDHYAAKQVIYAKIAVPLETTSADFLNFNSNGQKLPPSPTSASQQPPQRIRHINIFTTHTQASYYENTEALNSQNDSARLSQIQELLHFIDHKVYNVPNNAYNPVLILGDLNLDARASVSDGFSKGPEYRFLESLFLKQFQSCPSHVYAQQCGCPSQPASTEPNAATHTDLTSSSLTSPSSSVPPISLPHAQPICYDDNFFCDGVKILHTEADSAEKSQNLVLPPSTYQVRDLILERYRGEHPVTYGDARVDDEGRVVSIQEPVLTNSKDWACRLAIDYIFLITRSPPNHPQPSDVAPEIPSWPIVTPYNTNIQPFHVNPLHNPFFQLSDHYAVDTTLRIE